MTQNSEHYLSELISFASELHQINKLSEKIQRELNEERAHEISDYILNNDDRFFNSLVVAVYDGDPVWHDMETINPNNEEAKQLDFPDYSKNGIGFLSITKNEKFFALDGQHRLAGIKKAVSNDEKVGQDLLSVLIVAHKNNADGLIKSRRLFTTLNKKAKLVSKDAIIALDEDDIAACITRKLIDSKDIYFFNEENISFSSGPVRDKTSITSISNIYDNTQKLVAYFLNVKVSDLEGYYYRDHSGAFLFVKRFFELTFKHSKEFECYFNATGDISKFRNSKNGGYLLFRPIGWDVYTDVIISGLKNSPDELSAVILKVLSKNLDLSGSVFANKIWSVKQRKIIKLTSKKLGEIKVNLLKN